MTRIAMTLTIACLLTTAAHGQVVEGPCKLQESSGFDKKAVEVKVGKTIKGTCKFYIDEFFGKKIINANIALHNTGKKSAHCHYYVACFDKAGKLVGCASQGTFGKDGLDAGDKTQLGSCLIPLPKGLHERVASYKIAFYESATPVGKP